MKSYQKYYEEEHKTEWKGNILDKYYLMDLKKSVELLFDFERKINPEFVKQ